MGANYGMGMGSVNILIIESCEKVIKDKNASSIVHVKNSCILKEELNCDLVSHESEIENALLKKYDAIICAYASPYMKYNNYLRILDNNPEAKMYWLVNDHDVEDNILLRKWALKHEKTYDMICNNPREGYRGWILRKNLNGKTLNDYIKNWHTVYLNTLIYEFQCVKKQKSNIIYYGTFRKHRIEDLIKYNEADYYLSSSTKNHTKFKEAGIQANFIERLSWLNHENDLFDFNGVNLNDYKYSLYVEDKHTHDNYAFMANRFYECLMNNVVLFYDINCKSTLDKSPFFIDDYQIVQNGKELKDKTNQLDNNQDLYNKILSIQQSNNHMARMEKIDVLKQIKKIFNL